MRTFKTLPENRAFFEQYATLVPTLFRLGFLAQIVSGLTEISIIYAIVFTSVRDFAPALAPYIGAAGALIGTAFIEVGLRQFLPHSVRAVLYRRFSGLELAMTVFIILSTVALLLTSGALSFKNSKTIVEAITPAPEERKATEAANEYAQRKEEATAQFRADSIATAARHTGAAEALRQQYASLIALERAKLLELAGRESRTGQRFPTQRERNKTRIAELEAQQNGELATIEQRKAAELSTLQQTRQMAIGEAGKTFEAARSKVDAANDEARSKMAANVEKYGGGLAWFTVVCLVVLVFSVVLYEIHHKGSGITEAVEPTQYDFLPGVLAEAQTAIAERFNFSARSRIRKFAEATPAPPLPLAPAPLYDIGQMEQPRFVLQYQPGTGGSTPVFLNAPALHWANTQPAANAPEMEERVLEYCRAAEQLKRAGLAEPAREMELKAVDVLRLYLGSTATPESVEQLRAACVEHLKGNAPNPFQHLHRRPIGYNPTPLPGSVSPGSNGERYTENVEGKTRHCQHCGKGFVKKHWNARYCSDECRVAAWELRTGGTVTKGRR